MKKVVLILTFLSLVSSVEIYSQSGDAQYFPLAIGNKWVYRTVYGGAGPTHYGYHVMKITRDTIIDGERYYRCKNFWGTSSQDFWIRYNDATGFLVRYESTLQFCNYLIPYYKLTAVSGDSVRADCMDNTMYCLSVQDTNLFSISTTLKDFNYYFSEWSFVVRRWKLLKYIGPYYYYSEAGRNISYFSSSILKGYVMNNVVYGDTTSIEDTTSHSSVPYSYELFQNYPNPFNPKTTITLNLVINTLIDLSIYDVRGKKIATLTNQYYASGRYSFDWDASGYASGIYYYKIKVGTYTSTKKMVLIK